MPFLKAVSVCLPERMFWHSIAACFMMFDSMFIFFFSVDATKDNGCMGRLLNHSKTKANVVTKLFEIDSLPYLALLAKRDISVGEELVYDYGDRSTKAVQLFPWLEK